MNLSEGGGSQAFKIESPLPKPPHFFVSTVLGGNVVRWAPRHVVFCLLYLVNCFGIPDVMNFMLQKALFLYYSKDCWALFQHVVNVLANHLISFEACF